MERAVKTSFIVVSSIIAIVTARYFAQRLDVFELVTTAFLSLWGIIVLTAILVRLATAAALTGQLRPFCIPLFGEMIAFQALNNLTGISEGIGILCSTLPLPSLSPDDPCGTFVINESACNYTGPLVVTLWAVVALGYFHFTNTLRRLQHRVPHRHWAHALVVVSMLASTCPYILMFAETFRSVPLYEEFGRGCQ